VNRFLELIVSISFGIARDQRVRRKALFALTFAALVMLFTGATVLWNFFVAHPIFFALYWLACSWLVICDILLALFDLLTVINAGEEARHKARRKIFKGSNKNDV